MANVLFIRLEENDLLKKQLEELAKKEHRSLNNYVIHILKTKLEEEKGE